MSRGISRRASDTSASQMPISGEWITTGEVSSTTLTSSAIIFWTNSGNFLHKWCPHPQDEAREYRHAMENEPVSGVQQVFVKSACSTQPGQRERSLEKRRWSVETDLPIPMASTSCVYNHSEELPLSTSEPSPRSRKKTASRQRRFLSVSRKPLSPPSVINTQQVSTHLQVQKANSGRPTTNGYLSGQTEEAASAPSDLARVVEPETIYSVISDLLPGATSDRNRSRRYSEIIGKPDEFLRLLSCAITK